MISGSPLLSANELHNTIPLASRKKRAHPGRVNAASSYRDAYARGCLDVEYSGRCHIYSVYAAHRHCVSVSGADTRGAKGKKHPGKQFLLQVSHAPRYAIQNRTKEAEKEAEIFPKTEIEILIIKHAQLLRCIAHVRG